MPKNLLSQKAPVAQRSAATTKAQGRGQVDNRTNMGGVRQLQAAIDSSPRMVAQRRAAVRVQASNRVAQRVLMGNNGEFDTEDSFDYDGIKNYIKSKDYNTVYALRDYLLRHDRFENVIEYLNIIDKQIIKVEDQNLIFDKAGEEMGIWSMASVFVSGRLIGKTAAYKSGLSEGDMLDESNYSKEFAKEIQNSNADSEVNTLNEAYEIISNYGNINELFKYTRIKVLLTGNMGPCNGCKARIDEFIARVQNRLNVRNIKVESNYWTQVNSKVRKNVHTTYGYPDGESRLNAQGVKYYKKNIR